MAALGKQAITHHSRKITFLSWCHTIGLLDPCTPELPLQGCDWVLACYAVSLIHSNTITGMCLCHTAIQGYIQQALLLHMDQGLPHPMLADVNYIKIMTNAVRKYESIPKRKDMVLDSIFHYLAHLYRHASMDSFIHVIIDWIILGCYVSFQKSEWCSDHPCTFAMIYNPNWGNQPKALPVIADNVSFALAAGRCIPNMYTHNDTAIMFTSLCI